MRFLKYVSSGLVLAAAAAPGLASDQPGAQPHEWFEEATATTVVNGSPDAGQTLAEANATRGDGPLTRITGRLTNTHDVDIFCIRITDPASFSATTINSSTTARDHNLSLFDANGVGIAFNDNDPSGGVTSRLTNQFVTSSGLYYLAISRNDVGFGAPKFTRPLDGSGNLIFPGTPQGLSPVPAAPARNVEYGPITPGTVLAGWEFVGGGFQLFTNNYVIDLTGAGFHQLPAPGAGALLALAGIGALRRRRS